MATRHVLELPPHESLSKKVSLESRKGMWRLSRPFSRSARALMTLPRVRRDELMLEASFSRSPVALVERWRSEPIYIIYISLQYGRMQ